MKPRILLFAPLLFAATASMAQTPVSSEMEFISYLIGNGMASDAAVYLESESFAESDTLYFLRGWAEYSSGNQAGGAENFARVPEGSPFWERSIFSLALCRAYCGNYSGEVLDGYDGPLGELKAFQTAGLALLSDDMDAYRKARETFTYSVYDLREGQQVFDRIYEERLSRKEKSPFVAAALSSVVPGLGKFYAGRPDEGIMSFISVGCCAAIAAENRVKCGPDNWRTILFTALGAVFHIANIYGSYASVDIVNQRVENEQKAAVLYNLHIPIRNFYN